MTKIERRKVSQAELRAFNKLQAEYFDVRDRYFKAYDELKDRIKRRMGQEPGKRYLRPKRFTRRSVSWKGVVIRREGVEYAKRVLAHTEPKEYWTLRFDKIINPGGEK